MPECIEDVEKEWQRAKEAFVKTAEKLYGRTSGKGRMRQKNQWWWNKEVEDAIKSKREAWKAVEEKGKSPERLEAYRIAKKSARKAVWEARSAAQKTLYDELETDQGRKKIFQIAKVRDKESKDIVGTPSLKKESGEMVYEEKEILTVWKDYFSGLLCQKDVEEQSRRQYPSAVTQEAEYGEISASEVEIALKKMKRGKAAGRDEVTVEMIIAAGVEVDGKKAKCVL